MCCGTTKGAMQSVYTYEGVLCPSCVDTKAGREREGIMHRSAMALNSSRILLVRGIVMLAGLTSAC